MTSANVQRVEAFFDGLEHHDVASVASLLSNEVVETVPLSLTGSQDPFTVFAGKEEVVGYLSTIVENFSRTVLTGKEFTLSDDGETVFVEAKGDLTVRETGQPYRNVYVFRFHFADSLIVDIREYANPVTFAKAFALPLD